MVVTLSANDLFVLNFIMTSIKKHIKKAFIRQFGNEGTSKYKIFKETLKVFKTAKKDKKEVYLINLTPEQQEVLKMFIEGLLHRLKLEDKQNDKIKDLELIYKKVA